MEFQNVPKVWLAAPESTAENPVLVPFTYGEAVEGVEVTPDFSEGDMTVTMADGLLAKSAVIRKPEGLVPENIKKVALIRENTRAFPVQIYVEDAQYVYRDLPASVRPCGWWGEPYFIHTIPDGTYVGTTNLKGGRQFNSFSYENYDFSRFEQAQTTAPAETTTEPADTIPPSGDENTVYEDEP